MTFLHMVDRAAAERAAALSLPMLVAGIGYGARGRKGTQRVPGTFAACLLGVLWCLPALLLLQRLNRLAGWWSFPGADGARILGMPLELWLGWTMLWSVTAVFTFGEWKVLPSAFVLTALDCVVMPMCSASLHLHRHWMAGEAVAVLFVLVPSLWLQQWTLRGTHLHGRAALQVLSAAMLFLYMPAELAFNTFAVKPGWNGWLLWSPVARQVLVGAGLLLALPGLAAVIEFADRGSGTPIPYDPPQRLVTSGLYRYLANPMQASCTLVLLLWALALRSPSLLLGPVLCVIYSVGLAQWDEATDLRERFGEPWIEYRRTVGPWWPRWSPFIDGDATLYIARGCGPCSRVRRWIEARSPAGLGLKDAELLPPGSIRRMRYVSADGTETAEGVCAMGRALEHLHLGWALAGAVLRLPMVRQAAQLLVDACGFGPRVPVCDAKRV